MARSASRLPFTVNCGTPLADLLSALEQDNGAWCRVLWPYAGSSSGRGTCYFERISFKTPRPWFTGHRFPKGYISLVTRQRTGHICTGTHFARMGWDMDIGCGYGAELKSLAHLVGECPILSEGRPRFFRFLAKRFPGRPPERVDLGDLFFDPDPEAVWEIFSIWRSGHIGLF